jgi:rhodanese-related sulfurtransferase
MDVNEVLRITCEELKQSIDKGEDAVIIDTRNRKSYDNEHIEGALNIQYDPSQFQMETEMILSALPWNKLLVFYCDCTDDSESALMALDLINMGYAPDNIRALSGGWLRWKELGYPSEPV